MNRNVPKDAVHELMNQLGVVLGFMELLIQDTPESDPRRSDMLHVRVAARACLALLETR